MSLVLKRVINGKVFKSWRVSAANGTKQMGQFDGSKRATNSRTSAQTRLSAKPPSLPRADELKHRNPFLASSSWLPNPGELSLIAALALPLAPQARERSQTDGRKASMADQWERRNGGNIRDDKRRAADPIRWRSLPKGRAQEWTSSLGA